MDLSPREMVDLAASVAVADMLDFSAISERTYCEIVGARLGGAYRLRDAPVSARAYVYGLLGLDSSAPWETVLLCAARVGCTAPGMIKIHDDSDLAHPWDTDDIERYGYGCYTHPGCTPDNMLLTDGGLCSGDLSGVFCHVCGSDRGHTRCLWIHPQHLDTAINPSPNRDCSEE